MFESNTVVYKFVQDLHFFVTGGEYENELILATVLQGFFDAVGLLLRSYLYNTYYCLLVINFPAVFSVFHCKLTLTFNVCCFYFRGHVEKKEARENLELILLCLDEIVDGGYVFSLFHAFKVHKSYCSV